MGKKIIDFETSVTRGRKSKASKGGGRETNKRSIPNDDHCVGMPLPSIFFFKSCQYITIVLLVCPPQSETVHAKLTLNADKKKVKNQIK